MIRTNAVTTTGLLALVNPAFHRILFVGENPSCDSTVDSEIFYEACITGIAPH
jgi:hypothetical protein